MHDEKTRDICVRALTATVGAVCLLGSLSCIYHTLHPNSHPGFLSAASVLFGPLLAVVCLITVRFAEQPRKPVLVLLAIGLSLRFIAVLSMDNPQVSDFAVFHELATSLHNGTGLSYTGPVGLSDDVGLFLNDDQPNIPKKTAFRLPGLPVLLSLVYHITGPNPLAGKLLNVFMGALCGVLLYLLLSPWHRGAFIVAFLWEIYPTSVIATTVLCTEIPFTAALLLTMWLVAKSAKGPHHRWWAVSAGLCLGTACLFRPAMHLLIAAPLALLFVPITIRRRMLLITVTVFAASVPLSTWAIRNYVEFGEAVVNPTEQGISFFVITRELTGVPDPPYLDSMESCYFNTTNEFDKARLGTAIGFRRFAIALHNGHIFRQLARNFLRGWRDDTDFIYWAFEAPRLCGLWTPAWGAEATVLLISRMAYLALIVLGAVGGLNIVLRKTKITNPGVLLFMFYFIGSAILMALFEGQPRYHFSLMPMVCILAGYALWPVSFDLEQHRIGPKTNFSAL